MKKLKYIMFGILSTIILTLIVITLATIKSVATYEDLDEW